MFPPPARLNAGPAPQHCPSPTPWHRHPIRNLQACGFPPVLPPSPLVFPGDPPTSLCTGGPCGVGRSHARHRSDHGRSSVRNHPSTRPVTDTDTFLKENQAKTSKVPSPSPTHRLSLRCSMVMSWGQKRHPAHLPRECPVAPPRAEPWLYPLLSLSEEWLSKPLQVIKISLSYQEEHGLWTNMPSNHTQWACKFKQALWPL